MSEDEREVARRRRAAAVYPFNIAEYEVICPNGHPVELSTGYSSSAPSWWQQWGTCRICKRSVERMVGMRFRGDSSQFLAGPIHWCGEKTEEEENWIHDVLDEHRCERCYLLAKKELAQALLEKIRGESFLSADFTEVDIVSLLEELIA